MTKDRPFIVPDINMRGVKRPAPGVHVTASAAPSADVNRKRVKKPASGKVSFNDLVVKDCADMACLLEINAILENMPEPAPNAGIKPLSAEVKQTIRSDRSSGWRLMLERITSMIARNDELLRIACFKAEFKEDSCHRDQLLFIMRSLSAMHSESPLSPDWIRWAFSRLLQLLTGRLIFEKLGADVSSSLQQLLQMLQPREAETAAFFETMVEQLHALAQKAEAISLTRAEAPEQLRTEVEVRLRNGCETTIMHVMVDILLVHNAFDYAELAGAQQLQLWAGLFHLMRGASLPAQHSAVQLMHRLLAHGLASVEIVRVVVDWGAALMEMYSPKKRAGNERLETDKAVLLRDSILAIFKLLTERHLRKLRESKLLKGLQASVLIEWARRVLSLALVWLPEDIEDERVPLLTEQRDVLRLFSSVCCRILSSVRAEATAHLKEPLQGLQDDVKELVSTSLLEWARASPCRPGTTPAAAAAAAEERMAYACGLLLFMDCLNGDDANAVWISKATEDVLATCKGRPDSALRARHLVISSLAPIGCSEPRRVCGGDSAPSSSSSGKGAATAALADATPAATTALLQRLLPDNAQIVQFILEIDSEENKGRLQVSIPLLQALITLVSSTLPLSAEMTATAVALLSLPWMATEPDIAAAVKRHYRSLPLLRDLYPLRGVVRDACASSSLLRECTLAPLASLPRPAAFSEWRRAIYERALTLRPTKSAPSLESVSIVNAALSSLHLFVASVEPAAYEKTLSLVIDLVDMEHLEKSPVHIENVVRAIADSLCSLDGVSAHKRDAIGEWRCTACERLLHENVPTARSVAFPRDFVDLMVKVFEDDSIRQSSADIRIEAYGVLFTLLCHVQDAARKFEQVIIASLALIADPDEQVRMEYECTFQVVISMSPSKELLANIQHALDNAASAVDEEAEQRFYETTAPFLGRCAKDCDDVDFRKWSRLKLYALALLYPESIELTKLAHEVHSLEAKRDKEIRGDPKRFFVRQIRELARMLACELLSRVKDSNADKGEMESGEWSRQVDEECDYILRVAATIWGYDGAIPLLLKACASHLVAECFVVGVAEHADAERVLDRVKVHLEKERRTLIEMCIPAIVERIITESQASSAASELARKYCGAKMRELLNKRRFHCTLFVLRMMGDEEGKGGGYNKALSVLRNINRMTESGTLTEILTRHKNCEYLGYLQGLRRSLLDDENYDIRVTTIRSIGKIIELLDQPFLDDISSSLLMVLRLATGLGEEAVAVWSGYVERLGNEVLVAQLPQILMAVQPLLRFDSAARLMATIFEQRDTVNNEQSESFERAIMILLGGEGGGGGGHTEDDDGASTRIRKYLSKRRLQQPTAEDILLGCARMLQEEGATVGRVVLRRLEATLDGRPLRDDVAAAVMPALLHAIRVSGDKDVRLAALRCIGMVGAVDPSRLGLSLEAKRRREAEESGGAGTVGRGKRKTMLFVNSRNHEFHIDLLERAWRLLRSLPDADLMEIASYAIQVLLAKLVGAHDEKKVFARLPEECQKAFRPFLTSTLTNNNDLPPIDSKGKPLVLVLDNYGDWLLHNFLVGVAQIKNMELHDMFKALRWLVYTRDTDFALYLLPHLVIIMVMEGRDTMIEQYAREMEEVLRRTIDAQSPAWMRRAAHVVFAIIKVLERYAISKAEAGSKDSDYARVIELIKRVCSIKLPDGSLLVVVAAERCQCLLRALRWCEQFAIGGGVTEFGPRPAALTLKGGGLRGGTPDPFDRAPFYDLQRLYMQLNEVDGVAGAFETIAKNISPTADERILALEANGDYTEALPLYALSGEKKELKLLECLLRLNQPQLALSRAAEQQRGERDASTARAIEATQLEAAWHLRDWARLDEMIKARGDPLSAGGDNTEWGASCASLMSTLQKRSVGGEITTKTEQARAALVERLTALTIEDSDTYAQSYKYIAQLHMLAEIDDAKEQLLSDSEVSREQVETMMKYWEERTEPVAQCASAIEPMLRVRRELLRVAGGDRAEHTKRGVTGLLLQSCRLARQAGHLQIAWTFLVEAKALDSCHKAVGMEEARFEFQKGNQSEAIGLLTRLLNVRFPKINEIFKPFSIYHGKEAASQPISTQMSLTLSGGRTTLNEDELKLSASTLMSRVTKEEKAAYAEVQVLRTEYMLRAGASSPEDLYQTYIGMKKLDVPSEDLYYRVAVFCDGMMLHTAAAADVRPELIPNILSSYGQVLKYGRAHHFHAVPRMLTIWLDKTQSLAEKVKAESAASAAAEKFKGEIEMLNVKMREWFADLPLSVFFPAFPQLLSRILHPDASVFEVLTMILAKLMVAYPHQCLWQAIAVYRDSPDASEAKHSERMRKCKEVFKRARAMDKSRTMEDLVDQYDYVARQFITIAENDKVRADKEKLISKHFKPLYAFFSLKKMDTKLLLGATDRKLVGVKSVTPKVMMPMTEMLEQSIAEKEEDVKPAHFSQINVPHKASSASSSSSSPRDAPIVQEVFIVEVIDQFVVMTSMMAPRRISLRGSDGKIYGLLCKKDDELRKDTRLISFCKMMNCLMRRTPEARRRQLMVRTFSAIPLQARGGVIEWVPNLSTFKETISPLCNEYRDKVLIKMDWTDSWPADKKLEAMRSHFYKYYPAVTAEWQRRAFSDPFSWHTARLLFTRSCAVMSMIGFVLGLGDRHADNILVDQTDGSLMHVDFNILFNKGEKLKYPEIVPFRLTRNLVDGFGPTGAEGAWRKSAEATLEVMRSNADTLLTVMQAFIYDPLIEFGDCSRAQQNKKAAGPKQPEEKTKTAVNEVLDMIKNRLEGHIVTPATMKKHLSNTGRMSVSGQVAKLFEMATDEASLAKMYSGWSPYL